MRQTRNIGKTKNIRPKKNFRRLEIKKYSNDKICLLYTSTLLFSEIIMKNALFVCYFPFFQNPATEFCQTFFLNSFSSFYLAVSPKSQSCHLIRSFCLRWLYYSSSWWLHKWSPRSTISKEFCVPVSAAENQSLEMRFILEGKPLSLIHI